MHLKKLILKIRMWHYCDDIIKTEDFDCDKSYKSNLIYGISFKTIGALIGAKLLLIFFDKVDIFFKVFDETRQLVLFVPGKYDAIYNKIRYLKW